MSIELYNARDSNLKHKNVYDREENYFQIWKDFLWIYEQLVLGTWWLCQFCSFWNSKKKKERYIKGCKNCVVVLDDLKISSLSKRERLMDM